VPLLLRRPPLLLLRLLLLLLQVLCHLGHLHCHCCWYRRRFCCCQCAPVCSRGCALRTHNKAHQTHTHAHTHVPTHRLPSTPWRSGVSGPLQVGNHSSTRQSRPRAQRCITTLHALVCAHYCIGIAPRPRRRLCWFSWRCRGVYFWQALLTTTCTRACTAVAVAVACFLAGIALLAAGLSTWASSKGHKKSWGTKGKKVVGTPHTYQPSPLAGLKKKKRRRRRRIAAV
jgi:hypothetical protein